jgi:hypothetical protein
MTGARQKPVPESAAAGDGVHIEEDPSATLIRAYPARDERSGRSWTERSGHETVSS